MDKIYSVTQVNKYIKMVLDESTVLRDITIEGEITNFKAHYTGHLYFTLKDETSTIKCIMFKSYATMLKFKLEDGMKVSVKGTISVYEAGGTYQIYVKDIKPDGIGNLYLAYEQLKNKLEKEGLFNKSVKKNIPYLPKRVGVITSKTGAVVNDIINVTTRRFDKVNLLIYPAQVQGNLVGQTVIQGLKYFNDNNNVDVIIIARGGGSFEDLFGFNDEALAYEIFKSKIPIISAVGHETDYTICDFVSDLRAPTPSAAGELVYPEMDNLKFKISGYSNRNKVAIKNYILRKKEYIKRIKAGRLEKLPLDTINTYRMKILNLSNANEYKITNKLNLTKNKLNQNIVKIDSLSPLKTLIRGYSVCNTEKGNIVTKVDDVKKDDKVSITLTDGKISAVVI